ncbi:hypothetical protein OBBRIDRAFT_205047 [Obba rivulosa]|uniref:F-box domain-containing protein n=1 Tax=Obba rivulosa TaxID=1052685 RepID=A0A8E2AWP8_9APHY|nr:hypothetical protein OBBRIDRAFT_205047 [Obba rivulosa]
MPSLHLIELPPHHPLACKTDTYAAWATGMANTYGKDADILRLAKQLLDAAQETVDAVSSDTILAVEELLLSTLLVVRRTRNASQWINRVPVEILAEIFQYLVFQHPFLTHFPPTSRHSPPVCQHNRHDGAVVSLSHVCHSWRTVALSTPRLWRMAVLCCRPRSLLETCIERSRHVQLTFELYSDTHFHDRNFLSPLLESHSGRIREIYCDCESMGHYLQFPAPILTDLTLMNLHVQDQLPGQPFREYVPQLRNLYMDNVSFCPSPAISTNFTSVHISNSRINLGLFLSWLTSCSRLEHLSLHRALLRGAKSVKRRDVHLPYLHTLSCVSAGTFVLRSLFEHLSFSPATSIQLALRETYNRTVEESAVRVWASMESTVRAALLGHNGRHGFIAAGESVGVSIRETANTYRDQQFSVMSHPLARAHIQELWIVEDWFNQPAPICNLLQIFRAMPAVVSLTVYSQSLSAYLDALSRNDWSDSPIPLLPALTTVRILFSQAYAQAPHIPGEEKPHDANISAFAAARASLGCPISHLSIGYYPDYDGPAHDVAPILQHVDYARLEILCKSQVMEMPVECCSSTSYYSSWQPWRTVWDHVFNECKNRYCYWTSSPFW